MYLCKNGQVALEVMLSSISVVAGPKTCSSLADTFPCPLQNGHCEAQPETQEGQNCMKKPTDF